MYRLAAVAAALVAAVTPAAKPAAVVAAAIVLPHCVSHQGIIVFCHKKFSFSIYSLRALIRSRSWTDQERFFIRNRAKPKKRRNLYMKLWLEEPLKLLDHSIRVNPGLLEGVLSRLVHLLGGLAF